MERALRAFCVLKLVLGTMKYHGIMTKQLFGERIKERTFHDTKSITRHEIRSKKNHQATISGM